MGMTQADCFKICIPIPRQRQHGHWICIIDKQCVRAYLFHILREVHHHGDGAQRTEDAANAVGVSDRLPQAVFLGNFKIRHGAGLIAAHLDGVAHVLCAAQSFQPVGVFDDLRAAVVGVPVDVGKHHIAFFQTLRVNVIKRIFPVAQAVSNHAVA